MPWKSALIALAALAHFAAQAASPTFSFALIARSHPEQAYRLPAMSFFSDATPALNDAGMIAFALVSYNGENLHAIAYRLPGAELRTLLLDEQERYLSNPRLNVHNSMVWEEFDEGGSRGVFVLPAGSEQKLLVAKPEQGVYFSNPALDEHSAISYRLSSANGQAYESRDKRGVLRIAGTAALDPLSPYSYLFTPAFARSGYAVGKVRLGKAGETGEKQPDQLRLFKADGSSMLVAEDRDSNPNSPYASFGNSLALSASGAIAFIAAQSDGLEGIYLWSKGSLKLLAKAGKGLPLTAIEPFAPAINDQAQVVFRGKDSLGRQAIYLATANGLQRVVGAGDILPSDLGPARLGQHDDSPVFGGGLAINSKGDIAFNCGLTPQDDQQIEWGSGIYIATRQSNRAAGARPLPSK